MKTISTILSLSIAFSLMATVPLRAQEEAGAIAFPVAPFLFVDQPFNGCEGISFNGEGRLFATCNQALWEIGVDQSARQVAELFSNLGTAAVGDRDILVADFGPTNAFRGERNSDGIIWRITPEGEKTEISTGIGDPNFIVVLENGSLLVSDDATADIYLVADDGVPKLFSTAVNHPNGLALSADGNTLYVAQIFTSIRPVIADDAIWAIALSEGKPVRDAKLVVRTGPNAAVDGLAMDIEGRLYIAANGAGQLWRYDPVTEEMLLLASGMFGLASLAFGAGEFDHQSIYASATNAGGRGGKIWRIPVGTTGGRLYR